MSHRALPLPPSPELGSRKLVMAVLMDAPVLKAFNFSFTLSVRQVLKSWLANLSLMVPLKLVASW